MERSSLNLMEPNRLLKKSLNEFRTPLADDYVNRLAPSFAPCAKLGRLRSAHFRWCAAIVQLLGDQLGIGAGL